MPNPDQNRPTMCPCSSISMLSAAGFFGKVGGFFKNLGLKIARAFKDMVSELKKVTWPTKQELINYTLVTLAFMAAFVIIIGVQDSISAVLVKWLTNS